MMSDEELEQEDADQPEDDGVHFDAPESDDEASEPELEESSEDPEPQLPTIVDVISEDPTGNEKLRRRRVVRREATELSMEQRLEIEKEIISANSTMREKEKEKAAANKDFNGQISKARQVMDDAIDILKRNCEWYDLERIEEYDYTNSQVIYYDIVTDQEVDRRDMTEEEMQTTMF